MLALQALTPAALARTVPCVSLAEARKIVSAVHRDKGLAKPIAEVRRASLDAVREVGHVPALSIEKTRASAVDPFVKFALLTHDQQTIETVRIPLERAGRFSVCVSSQVGCALGCAFCATGQMGLRRNLLTWEIVEQVRVVRRTLDRGLGQRVHGVVFQGMGEPMANLDRVLEAIGVINDPSALAVDARAITVCTAGIPSGIRRLAREAPKVRLGVSIGSAHSETRRALMPIEGTYPLCEVLDACVEHAQITGLAPMWALVPLAGLTDSATEGRRLAELASDFTARARVRPRISLIPYNPIDGAPFSRADALREVELRSALRDAGFPTHTRYSGGGDVLAACGQLSGRA
jgi:23S rRNA (adenine2503-C2)-methyltransferase